MSACGRVLQRGSSPGAGALVDAFLANHIICKYASHGRLEEAMEVFTRVPVPSRHMWSSIILANARLGQPAQALKLYRHMRQSSIQPNNHIFVAALKACATAQDLSSGRAVHADILGTVHISNIFVGNCLVDMYAKCGSIEDARRVFDNLPSRNVVTWTAMIAGYTKHGLGKDALVLYADMQHEGVSSPNHVTFACLLQACACVGTLYEGKQLHVQIQERGLESNVLVGNRLVDMYSKCGSMEDARRVFDNLPSKDVVTCTALIAGYARCGKLEEARRMFDNLPTRDVVLWNAMIAGYSQQGLDQEALALYDCMQQDAITAPNSVTYACLLQACASAGALNQGKNIHLHIQERGLRAEVLLGNALVSMYAKCGSLGDARKVFDRMPSRDVVTWTAMIAGYAQHGFVNEALSLYGAMQQEGTTPADAVTFVCLLQACGNVADLEMGKEVHAQICKIGCQASDLCVASTLIDMYGKCGSMLDAQQIFDGLPRRGIVAWGALIAGYARQGHSDVVFHLFQSMIEEGTQPDSITLLSVLTVCSHVGLVDEGQKWFEAMSRDYNISPTTEHYRCMVDLLGRAGHVEKAMEMVKAMPVEPHIEVWRSVLGACRKWNSNVELGRLAFERAVRLDKSDAAAYVLMANIYADAHMPKAAKETQALRVKAQAWKKPGESWWTDGNGIIHTFVVDDRRHPERQYIDAKLESLVVKMEQEGCLPCLESI